MLSRLPQNDPALVELLMSTLGWDPSNSNLRRWRYDFFRKALTSYFEITKLTRPLLQNAAAYFDNEALEDKVQDSEWIQNYIEGRDFIDLLNDFPPEELEPKIYIKLENYLPENILYQVVINHYLMKFTLRLLVQDIIHTVDTSVCSVQFANVFNQEIPNLS